MRKLMLFALAILLAFAAAIPASAQYQIPIPQIRIVESGNDGYRILLDQRGYSHREYNYSGRGRRESLGREIFRAGRDYDYENGFSRIETPSQCYERIVKTNSKRHVSTDAASIMAFCSGQQIQSSGQSERRPVVEEEREERFPSKRAPGIQSRETEETAVFHNCTRVRVHVGDPEVGGFDLESGEERQAEVSSPVWGNFDGDFRRARIVWQNNMALITAPKGS